MGVSVSRLSSAGIHVPIISSMRIIALQFGRHPIRTQLFRLHPMRCHHSHFPCVGSVCVTPNYNVTCIRVLTHVISGPGQLYDPFIRLISLFVSHAGLMLGKRWAISQSESSISDLHQWRGEEGDLWDVSPILPSLVDLSAASRPHPSPATRNKTETWLIDDTTRKGGIHLEQDDFHGEQGGNIYEKWMLKMF